MAAETPPHTTRPGGHSAAHRLLTGRYRRRPFGLYAVLVLLFLQGPSLLVSGDQVSDGLARVLPAGQDPTRVAEILGIPVEVIVLVLIVGLWRRRRWAWVGTMLFVGVGLTFGIIQYVRGLPVYGAMLLNVFIAFYLNQREVQAAFERRHPHGPAPPRV
jgi:hypothetical protein